MFFRGRTWENAIAWVRWEWSRWLFLVAVSVWILQPLATARRYGTGDALWYADMLADYTAQIRAGVFPVFVGQTPYAFNGAVYPLRAAPLYQHLGGLLDLITLHRLGIFSLQHLELIAVGFGAILAAYFCLTALLPTNRWMAALLAALFFTCPGVLALVYIQDLQMSWTAVPFVPIALLGTIWSFRRDGIFSWSLIAIGLGGLWWAHAPIAFWMSGIVGLSQIIRLIFNRQVGALRRALVGVFVLLILAQYPFISIWTLRSPSMATTPPGGLEHSERIVEALSHAFPKCLLPLSRGASELSDLQLGYGLVVALCLAIAGFSLSRQLPLLIFLGAIVAIVALLVPIPHWTAFVWLQAMPDAVKRITFYWPMHRFYLILDGLVVFAAALGIASIQRSKPKSTVGIAMILALSVGWSLWESREFRVAAKQRTASAEDTERSIRPENRLLMNHAYGLFAKLPEYYSNGVMDPRAELRLLDAAGKVIEPPLGAGRTVIEGDFEPARDANPGIVDLRPILNLLPGLTYELRFNFPPGSYHGVLQVVGTTFFREYLLPHSGEIRAFGTEAPNSSSLSIWTTRSEGEPITLRFIGASPADNRLDQTFAHFTLVEIPNDSPRIRVDRWVPLKVEVAAETPGFLETPRMFVPGYTANINHHTEIVTASAQGLCVVPISKGISQVELRYKGPLLLRFSYWIGMLGWCSIGAVSIRGMMLKIVGGPLLDFKTETATSRVLSKT